MSPARLSFQALLVLLLVTTSCGDDNVTQYVNWLELQVQEIAKQAVRNDQQSSELLQTCEGNCSRHICTPSHDDLAHPDKLQCISVPQNKECDVFSSDKTCRNMSVSLSKSYVVLPACLHEAMSDPVNSSPFYISRTVCSQRMLDPLFQNIWNDSHYHKAWVFFGSTEGVQRIFPGREWSSDRCSTFEPRKRPWYVAATSVIKDLVLVLDYGSSMNDPFSYVNNVQKHSVALNITQDLLDTLSIGDQITAFRFNSRDSTKIFKERIDDSTSIANLMRSLKEIPYDGQPGQSNLSLAIPNVLGDFDKDSPLKIMMIFTDANVNFGNTIQGNVIKNILVFIFILGASSEGDLSGLAPLPWNPSIVRINDTDQLQNPLWAIRSYFDVMAQLRFNATKRKPYWVPSFEDKSGLGNILTVNYPAFENSTHLIGIAGIALVVSELPNDFESAISARPGLNASQLPSTFEYQFTIQDNKHFSIQIKSGFCDGESRYDYLQLLCCGTCNKRHSKLLSRTVVLIISACGIVALLSIIAIVRCVFKKVQGKTSLTYVPQELQGGSDSSLWSKPL